MEFEKVCGLVDGVGEKVWWWLWCARAALSFLRRRSELSNAEFVEDVTATRGGGRTGLKTAPKALFWDSPPDPST